MVAVLAASSTLESQSHPNDLVPTFPSRVRVHGWQFDDDFYEFRCSIKELERRLGAVVSLAFDDCATVYGRFKLLDSFEGLLERPIIQVRVVVNRF